MINQYNRIENSEIHPYIFGQLTFHRGTKTIQWEKDRFSKMVLGQLDMHMQKNEVEPYLIWYTKIVSEWIKVLYVKVFVTLGDTFTKLTSSFYMCP